MKRITRWWSNVLRRKLNGSLDEQGVVLNKVPFALELETGTYVDVADVSRGLKCSCICPSCKTPLSAKQGDKNTWHFAHATRGTSEKTETECEYSFYVSVTQMAKQLFSDKKSVSLALPDYISEELESLGAVATGTMITKASKVSFDILEIDTQLSKLRVDVLGEVGGFPFVINFSHPEKELNVDPGLLHGKRAGVIAIDLTNTFSLFKRQKATSITSFKSQLAVYLFEEGGHIKWLYHPRESVLIDRLIDSVNSSATASQNLGRVNHNEKDLIDRALEGFRLNRDR